MNPRRKTLFVFLFSVLLIDLSSFTVFYLYPQIFSEYLINQIGLEASGLMIVWGFITAIVASTGFLFITCGELRAVIVRPLRAKMIRPQVEKVGVMGQIKEFVEKNLRKGLEY